MSSQSTAKNHSLHRRYFTLLVEQKGFALLGILLAVVTAYSGIALLAVSGWFISAAALAGLSAVAAHAFNFFTPGAMVRGLSISRTAGRYAERLSTHEATFRLIAKLRADLFRTISEKSWFETPFNRHDLSSRLLQDIDHIERIYLFSLVPVIVSITVVIGYLMTLWLVCPSALYWAIPFVLGATLVMPMLYSRLVLSPEAELHDLKSQTWQQASSLLNSLRTLTLFRQLTDYSQALDAQSDRADGIETLAINRQRFALLATQLLMMFMVLVVFWQGVEAFSAGEIEGAYLFMLLLLSMGVSDALLSSSPAFASFCLGWAALTRISETLSENTSDINQANSVTNHSGLCTESRSEQNAKQGSKQKAANQQQAPFIEIQDLAYQYPNGQHTVLEQFNFKQQGAAWIELTGKSGCGKSTLLHLIAGFMQPKNGTISCSPTTRFMPQKIDILRASLRDNLCLHLDIDDDRLWQALEKVELADWAKSLPLELNTWLGDGEWQVSGGEAKRIGIARLWLQKGDIILLDEPFAGIDTELANRLQTWLCAEFHQDLVILSSHDSLEKVEHAQALQLPSLI